MDIKVTPIHAFRLLLGVAGFLIVVHVLAHVLELEFGFTVPGKRVIHLDREQSIPTLFSVLILSVSSVLLLLIGLKEKLRGAPYVLWMLLAAIFVFVAIDEGASIHEQLIDPMKDKYQLDGFLRFGWVIPYFSFFVLVGLLYLRFLLRLPREIMWLFIIGGSLYVLGAVGFEMIGGKLMQLGWKGWPITIAITVEESLEMVGIVVFIFGLLKFVTNEQGGMCIALQRQV